jgi:hypothetical protein
MMKTIALGAVAAVSAADNKELFMNFMKKYGKQYAAEELGNKFAVFESNMKMINEHNAKDEGWTMGVNEFTDLTADEFSALFKGYKHRNQEYIRSQNLHKPSNKAPAADIDWVSKGAVTPIKDQGQCGSCWSFSTTGGVEGANYVSKNKLTSLSEQQLVDCAGSSGNQGCNGGLMDDAFQWIISNGGLASEDSYPYHAKDGTCKKESSVVSISSFKDVKKGSEDDLLDALQQQPISIAVDAQSGWQTYSSGVMKFCFGKQLDHGVLLVGAGTDGSTDYWKVKNSWGKSWGEEGYIRLKRGMNACGLAEAASYPVV